jgi:small subunit ribosomal protein S8
MSHDVVADTLNQVMNAKRASKGSVTVKRHSKFLLSVLAIGKLKGYIRSFQVTGTNLEVEIGDKLNACLAVKPRYITKAEGIMKYVRRYLPSRDMGVLIISTSQGLMTHHTAIEKNLGGSVIAYFY